MDRLIPIADVNVGAISDLAMKLKASPLEAILYRPAGDGHSLAERWSGSLHEVDLDVRIVTTSAIMTISWARDDLIEGLSMTLSTLRNGVNSAVGGWIPVTDLPEWRSFLGGLITDVALGWHVTEDGCPRSVWSIRFMSDTGKSFVVVLGEVDDNELLSYHPDALLVLFDEERARSYRTVVSHGSSWAE